MVLHEIEIRNFKSLEHVHLTDLGHFNVLVGRNNAGKSAVFDAIRYLATHLERDSGREHDRIDAQDMESRWVLTGAGYPHVNDRRVEIRLRLELGIESRRSVLRAMDDNERLERIAALLQTDFLRQVWIAFTSYPGQPHAIRLERLDGMDEEGNWVRLCERLPDRAEKTHRVVSSDELIVDNRPLVAERIDLGRDATFVAETLHLPFAPHQEHLRKSYPIRRCLWVIFRYLQELFFFSAFRHGESVLPVQQQDRLSRDGANLAQVLQTIANNDRGTFDRIEAFLHEALPRAGRIHTRIEEARTYVTFRPNGEALHVRLTEMGGGVEQLLMIATALFATSTDRALFLEEPETHLHPGAQRFLIEQLHASGRQVFVTTHSPTFVNSHHTEEILRVQLAGGRTRITAVRDAPELGGVLEDIGSRNSDLLLSDAVLFVEGPSDKEVFQAWSEMLKTSLEGHNVTVISMGGGRDASRSAPMRSELLERISAGAVVPHLFVVDRDERSGEEVERLLRSMDAERLHVLERRELENYLLVPRPVLQALREKHPDHRGIEACTEEVLDRKIRAAAEALKPVVLLKRLRERMPRLNGMYDDLWITELAPEVDTRGLPAKLKRALSLRFASRVQAMDWKRCVREERARLAVEWADLGKRLCVTPGEEILTLVFRECGSKYRKTDDAVRIARAMREDEIPAEIREIVERAIRLAQPG